MPEHFQVEAGRAAAGCSTSCYSSHGDIRDGNDEEHDAGRRQAVDQAIQESLRSVSIQCRFSTTRSRGWT